MLQAKEAEASVLEPALGASAFANHGSVVEGQRLTQFASDIMLGWLSVEDQLGIKRDFYLANCRMPRARRSSRRCSRAP